MAETPVNITLGGQTFLWTSDMKIINLSNAVALGTVNVTLHDEVEADYQVPGGKVFKMLEIWPSENTATKNITITSSTVVNSATGEVVKLTIPTIINVQSPKINCDLDFAAALFVNAKESNTTGTDFAPICIGIEMDV